MNNNKATGSDLRKKIRDIWAQIRQLESTARGKHPNLFLFDTYYFKPVSHDINNESVLLLYLITNLYGLFFDTGKYLVAQHVPPLNKKPYDTIAFSTKRRINGRQIAPVLSWQPGSFDKIVTFYEALNEIRSVFCHNKTPAAAKFDTFCALNSQWNSQPDLLKDLITSISVLLDPTSSSSAFNTNKKYDYLDLFETFFNEAKNILVLIKKDILDPFSDYNSINGDCAQIDHFDRLYFKKWFIPIFYWYLDNQTVYTRTINDYFCGSCIQKPNKYFACSSISELFEDYEKPQNFFNYAYHMYVSHFSLKVLNNTKDRRKLTPANLFRDFLNCDQLSSGQVTQMIKPLFQSPPRGWEWWIP